MRCLLKKYNCLEIFTALSSIKMANNTVTTSNTAPPIAERFLNVSGDKDQQNDLILCSGKEVQKSVIFFGGDVQNYPEIMKQHRTNGLFVEWNLETTAQILAKRFPDSLVTVVKPKQMLLNTFSIYSNFVEFDQDGLPTLFTNTGALNHLTKLHANALKLHNIDKNSELSQESSNPVETKLTCEDIPISIVGFSKGCVPLNQIMYEIATTSVLMSPEVSNFVSRIESVYWLDAGHNARKDIWITSDFVLQKLASMKLPLFVHVTPYQIMDPNRPWIGKEYKKFIQKLKSYSANIKETKHYFDEPGSLEKHFYILKEF